MSPSPTNLRLVGDVGGANVRFVLFTPIAQRAALSIPVVEVP
jgi:hypothetical protein